MSRSLYNWPFYHHLGQTVLSLSVTTTITTADVSFIYEDRENVERFVAYVNQQGSSQKCSVSPKISPLRCTLKGIREAAEFTVIAQACLREKPTCEPVVMQKARTQLRGPFYCLLSSMYFSKFLTSECFPTAPGLDITAASSTEVRLQFIPSEKPNADYYVANFKGGNNDTPCLVGASEQPLVCSYKDLKPSTMYEFEYFAGVKAMGSDIVSEEKYRSVVTPANRKFPLLPKLCNHNSCFFYCKWSPMDTGRFIGYTNVPTFLPRCDASAKVAWHEKMVRQEIKKTFRIGFNRNS